MTDAYYEQEHTDCGGSIVLVMRPKTGEWRLCCRGCKDSWQVTSPLLPIAQLPKDFTTAKSLLDQHK